MHIGSLEGDVDGVLTGWIVDKSIKDEGQLRCRDKACAEVGLVCAAQEDLGGCVENREIEVVVKGHGGDGSGGKAQLIRHIQCFVDGSGHPKIHREAGKLVTYPNGDALDTFGLDV
ncbi:MAG: hypothetical protein BWY72_02427 [Bacteroidetes bacterium ADurb.Bin416]|nr:MAG: hypothetical protein BWY72_02427 [Bacteroidetes bacterium ADurb.Bin416]